MTQDAALRCTQRTQRKIEIIIDPILAFTTQHDASATEGVHKLKRNATQRHIKAATGTPHQFTLRRPPIWAGQLNRRDPPTFFC